MRVRPIRVRSGWLAAAASAALLSVAATSGAGDPVGRSARTANGLLSLSNGVRISSGCERDDSATLVQHITFSTKASHTFLGYGVNLQASKGAADIPRTIKDLHELGFVWVKTVLVKGDKEDRIPTDQTPADAEAAVAGQVRAGVPDAHRRLYDALHAAGIKIVDTIHPPPAGYFASIATERGKPSRRIDRNAIPSLARYYAAYIRAMTGLGIHPDLIEMVNEPNLRRAGLYRPAEYAELLKGVETDLHAGTGAIPRDVNFSAPATASNVPAGLQFVEALDAIGVLPSLKAITLHTYYVRDRPNNAGIPPADDPAMKSLVTTARKLGIPVISTEFGGTDLKMKKLDPNKEAVDPAEELKATLDLIRLGESAAIVWDLYPTSNDGATERTWALVDATGPTNAYWPFYILSRRVPVGSDVLEVEQSDVSPTMTSPGYAAFRSGQHIYVGLSNPAPSSAVSVALNLSRLGNFSVVHAATFSSIRAIESDASIRSRGCPVNVMLPGGTGTVLDINQSQ
jgi:hypothetical protein